MREGTANGQLIDSDPDTAFRVTQYGAGFGRAQRFSGVDGGF
jgi:hypothetical protein